MGESSAKITDIRPSSVQGFREKPRRDQGGLGIENKPLPLPSTSSKGPMATIIISQRSEVSVGE